MPPPLPPNWKPMERKGLSDVAEQLWIVARGGQVEAAATPCPRPINPAVLDAQVRHIDVATKDGDCASARDDRTRAVNAACSHCQAARKHPAATQPVEQDAAA
eukprot:828520-Prymnesium_polylepis.1